MRPDIVPGARFPDYELPDHTDVPRRLSVLQGDDPLILTLNRGFYCPKDRLQLQQLVDFYPQLAVGYAQIVTITTDTLMQLGELRLGLGAQWTFLHDDRRVIQKDLDIAEYTDSQHNPMVPHTFVLEPGLRIHKIYNGYWYWGRPSTWELHQDLRDITQRIRPDFDIGDAALRKEWEQGQKEHFFPYGHSFRDVLLHMYGAVDQYKH